MSGTENVLAVVSQIAVAAYAMRTCDFDGANLHPLSYARSGCMTTSHYAFTDQFALKFSKAAKTPNESRPATVFVSVCAPCWGHFV